MMFVIALGVWFGLLAAIWGAISPSWIPLALVIVGAGLIILGLVWMALGY